VPCIEELLGLDSDDETIKQLREAREDRKVNNKDPYIELNAI